MTCCGMFEALCRHTGAALAIYAAQTSLQNIGHLAIGVNAQRAKIFRTGQIGFRGPEHGQSRGSQATGGAYKLVTLAAHLVPDQSPAAAAAAVCEADRSYGRLVLQDAPAIVLLGLQRFNRRMQLFSASAFQGVLLGYSHTVCLPPDCSELQYTQELATFNLKLDLLLHMWLEASHALCSWLSQIKMAGEARIVHAVCYWPRKMWGLLPAFNLSGFEDAEQTLFDCSPRVQSPGQANASKVTAGHADLKLHQPKSAADLIAAYQPSKQLDVAAHSSAAVSTADTNRQSGSNRQASGLEQHLEFCYYLEELLGTAQSVPLTWPVQEPEAASCTELADATGADDLLRSSSSWEGVGHKPSGVLESEIVEVGDRVEAQVPLSDDAGSADATSEPLMSHMQAACHMNEAASYGNAGMLRFPGVDNLTIKAPEVYNIEEQSADLASIKLPQNHVASGHLTGVEKKRVVVPSQADAATLPLPGERSNAAAFADAAVITGMDSPAAVPVAHHSSQQQGDVEREFGSSDSSSAPMAEETETSVSFDAEPWVSGVADLPSSPSSCEEDSSSTSSYAGNGVPVEVDAIFHSPPGHPHSSDSLTAPHPPERTGPTAHLQPPSPPPQRQPDSPSPAAAISGEQSCQQSSVGSPSDGSHPTAAASLSGSHRASVLFTDQPLSTALPFSTCPVLIHSPAGEELSTGQNSLVGDSIHLEDSTAVAALAAAAVAVAEQVEADAALARLLQYGDLSDEDAEDAAVSSAAVTESGLQRSGKSSRSALQAETARGRVDLTAPIGRSSSGSSSSGSTSILSRPELPAIRTSLQLQPSSQHLDAEPARTEEEQVAQALAQSLAESVAGSGGHLAYPAEAAVVFVGGRMPLTGLAEAFKKSPTVGGNLGRLLGKFSHVRYIRGDGNCFYRALMTAMLEGLCHAPRPEHIRVLSQALMSQHAAVASCLDIGDDCKAVALRGHLNFQDLLFEIGTYGRTWEEVQGVLNEPDFDSAGIQFLRAVTARELLRNSDDYGGFIAGIEQYEDMDPAQVVQQETLRMRAETEQVQVTALTAVLPVRLKLLSTAGAEPYVQTFQPDPCFSTSAGSAAAGHMVGARSVQQVWLVHRPGHYEVVYPAIGFENVDGAVDVW